MQNTAYLIWKGQNRKSQNMEFRPMSVFQLGYFNFIYAEQYKNVIRNKKCIEFTMGQTSDSMTTMACHSHRWVSAWYFSLAGSTVAHMGVFFSSGLSVSWELISLFPGSMFVYLIVSHGDTLDKLGSLHASLTVFFSCLTTAESTANILECEIKPTVSSAERSKAVVL